MQKITKKIICGNWKMNPVSAKEADKLFSGVAKAVAKIKKTEVVVCAPYIYLSNLKKISKKISLGAQDAYAGDVGAFTGEVSAEMLYNLGVRYVILGHSERRAMGETNGLINKKVKGALASGLTPILCVGESERDLEHQYFNLVKNQLDECLDGVSRNSFGKIIIAYEPIWAISTTLNRRDATPADSHEMALFIRKIVSDKLGGKGEMPRVIYGGSVNERDAEEFIKNGGVDGLLPGRASLDPKKFSKIIEIADKS